MSHSGILGSGGLHGNKCSQSPCTVTTYSQNFCMVSIKQSAGSRSLDLILCISFRHQTDFKICYH